MDRCCVAYPNLDACDEDEVGYDDDGGGIDNDCPPVDTR